MAARDSVCSSLLLACFHGTSSSRTSLTHRDGPIELSPQSVIGPTRWVWGYFPGQIGEKSEAKVTGGTRELWPSRVHTQDLSKTNDGSPKTCGLRSGAAESSEDLDGWHSQRISLPRPGPARRRALHPPRRLIPNLTTGAMRNWPGQPPSPAHYSAPSGVLHDPPLTSHWPVPATTDDSVEPHTHHRRPPHAWALLAPRGATWREMERIVQNGQLST